MSHKICLSFRLPDGELLYDVLKGYGFSHFMRLIALAAEGRDPAYVPARRAALLHHEMNMNRKRFDHWLGLFAGKELVEVKEDGGLLLTYLLDQEDGGEEDAGAEVAYLNGNGVNGNGVNGNGVNGNGTERRRQPRRNASGTPDARRAREKYWRDKSGGT